MTRLRQHPKVSKRALVVAKRYAFLDPAFGYPDMNAAIVLAKALLRVAGKDGKRR